MGVDGADEGRRWHVEAWECLEDLEGVAGDFGETLACQDEVEEVGHGQGEEDGAFGVAGACPRAEEASGILPMVDTYIALVPWADTQIKHVESEPACC